MKLRLPEHVNTFRIQMLELLHLHRIDTSNIWIFGGCIRDMFLGGKINDYDIILNMDIEVIKGIFNRHKIYYEINANIKDKHIYVPLKDDLLQFGAKNEIPPDFTINGLKASFQTLDILSCPSCIADLEKRLLRSANPDIRQPRRAIYMLYKYPDLTIHPDTLKMLLKLKISKANTLAFIERKKLDVKQFYRIAEDCGLTPLFSFLKHL